MGKRDEEMWEVVKGLDGLVMLSTWETTLLKDLRDKALQIATKGPAKGRPDSDPPGAGAEDCGPSGGESVV